MVSTNINRRYGTKWFTFFTKVRPWFIIISMISVVVDFAEYTDIYLSKWYLILYVLSIVIHAVLSMFVFIKSFEDYNVFVKFVKSVLLFELLSVIYQVCINQYIQTMDASTAVVTAAFSFLIYYFIWYRLNVKYFEKRIASESDLEELDYMNNPSLYEAMLSIAESEAENSSQENYIICDVCGADITDDIDVCHVCGKAK